MNRDDFLLAGKTEIDIPKKEVRSTTLFLAIALIKLLRMQMF